MTWRPDHPGGRIHCDEPACTASRRAYGPPVKREGWVSVETGGPYASRIADYCSKHSSKERQP